MKTLFFLLNFGTLSLIYPLTGHSQNTVVKDTVKISVSNQNIIIPMPESGNRTTVTFENSAENIEVSVFRVNKNAVFSPSLNQEISSVKDSLTLKRIRWLTDLKFGYLGMLDKSALTDDLFQGVPFHNNEYINIYQLKTSTKNPYGFFVDLTLKEKERKLNNPNTYLITGIQLTFNYIQISGGYVGDLYQQDTGIFINSTMVSSSFTLRNSSLGLAFPLTCRKIFYPESKYPFRFDLGVNLVAKLFWRDLSDGFTSNFYGEDENTTGLSFFPQIYTTLTKGPVGIFAAIDVKPLSVSINNQNRYQTFTAGLCIRPFHSFGKK